MLLNGFYPHLTTFDHSWQPFGQDLVLGELPIFEWGDGEEMWSLQEALERNEAVGQVEEPRDSDVGCHVDV